MGRRRERRGLKSWNAWYHHHLHKLVLEFPDRFFQIYVRLTSKRGWAMGPWIIDECYPSISSPMSKVHTFATTNWSMPWFHDARMLSKGLIHNPAHDAKRLLSYLPKLVETFLLPIYWGHLPLVPLCLWLVLPVFECCWDGAVGPPFELQTQPPNFDMRRYFTPMNSECIHPDPLIPFNEHCLLGLQEQNQ